MIVDFKKIYQFLKKVHIPTINPKNDKLFMKKRKQTCNCKTIKNRAFDQFSTK